MTLPPPRSCNRCPNLSSLDSEFQTFHPGMAVAPSPPMRIFGKRASNNRFGQATWLLCVGGLVIGCGSDDKAAEPDAGLATCHRPDDAIDGRLSPERMSRVGCMADAFKNFDPSGLWWMKSTDGNPFSSGPLRLEASCEEGVAATRLEAGWDQVERYMTPDDVFINVSRTAEDSRYEAALNLCGTTADGDLVGHQAECTIAEGITRCTEYNVLLSPLTRIEGESESQGLRLVSEWRGAPGSEWPTEPFTANVEVFRDVAYVARHEDGLRIVDVSNPEAPKDLAHYPTPNDSLNDVMVFEQDDNNVYAVVAGGNSGTTILNVSDPANPVRVTTLTNIDVTGTHRLFVEQLGGQRRIYLADGSTDELQLFDITDPETPQRLPSYSIGFRFLRIHAVYAVGGVAYINATYGGLHVVDLNDPENPVRLGRLDDPTTTQYSHTNAVIEVGGKTLSIHTDEGADAHLRVIDVTRDTASFLTDIGSFKLRQVSAHNLIAVGSTVYLAHYQDGLRVLDLSTPSQPRQVAYFNTWNAETSEGANFEGAVDVDVDNSTGLIYVADSPRGLLILEQN